MPDGKAPVPSPVPPIPYASIPDWVNKIALEIFRAKIDEMTPFPDGWRIWMGDLAHYEFQGVALGRGMVGITGIDGIRITEKGEIGLGRILGIRVYPDRRAPIDQWRLSDVDGRTLAQGVWR
jgi:hypothetical protein